MRDLQILAQKAHSNVFLGFHSPFFSSQCMGMAAAEPGCLPDGSLACSLGLARGGSLACLLGATTRSLHACLRQRLGLLARARPRRRRGLQWRRGCAHVLAPACWGAAASVPVSPTCLRRSSVDGSMYACGRRPAWKPVACSDGGCACAFVPVHGRSSSAAFLLAFILV